MPDPFSPYPRFGAVGEQNQLVLRGGSCATSPGHDRAKGLEKREAATRKRFRAAWHTQGFGPTLRGTP